MGIKNNEVPVGRFSGREPWSIEIIQ